MDAAWSAGTGVAHGPSARCASRCRSEPDRRAISARPGPAGSVPGMVRPLGLPFDPIERAGQTWEKRFGPASAMRAATSVFRVQQILLARFDEVLKPHGLTFARYEVLVLLTFSRTGELPLKVIGSRLMVHPTSVTNAIDRLVAAGYVDRRPNPNDGRGVLAAITDDGRRVVEQATTALTDLDFGLGDLSEAERAELFDVLKRVRLGAGDVAGRGASTADSWTSYYLGMTQDARQRWQQRYDAALAAGKVRDADFTTLSGVEVDPVYGPADESAVPGFERIGYPGEFPFTRGLHATGYRGRAWTIRQFAGFGNAQQTNERYKMILAEGGGGLSVAFDMPTLMGRDSDDPRALGEVGHCGVAIDTAADMDVLFDDIPLDETTTSMTISGPAVPVFCMYLVAAERQGVDIGKLNGTLQTDIFKEYIAQKEWLFAPEPHLRLIGDLMEYCAEKIPAYKPISVSGYHIREAGSTAAQELAFTLADGFAYVELGLSRGLDIEQFAPGLSFFFDAHLDFFEEIAKFRAARRIWARWLRDVYGATDGEGAAAAVPHPDGRRLA